MNDNDGGEVGPAWKTILMGSPEDMDLVNSYTPKESDMFFQMSDGSKKRLMFGEPLEYSE